MTGISLRERLAERVSQAFATLPERYLGAEPASTPPSRSASATSGASGRCACASRALRGAAHRRSREPDVVIGTDASTWIALREGRMSGLDAFSTRRLYARGDLDLALGFEGMFALPGGRPPLVRVAEVSTRAGPHLLGRLRAAGAEQVLCLHGLGSNKTSFFETVSALTPELHGPRDRPARVRLLRQAGPGRVRRRLLRARGPRLPRRDGIDQAHLVGNSMGGRVAIEVALDAPERVASLSLLAPAVAFRRRRELVPLVKLLRPELASIPHAMRAGARPPAALEPCSPGPSASTRRSRTSSADEFCRTYRSRAARVAFFAAAAEHLPRRPVGRAAGSGRAWPSSSRRRSSCGATPTASSPPGSRATSPRRSRTRRR